MGEHAKIEHSRTFAWGLLAHNSGRHADKIDLLRTTRQYPDPAEQIEPDQRHKRAAWWSAAGLVAAVALATWAGYGIMSVLPNQPDSRPGIRSEAPRQDPSMVSPSEQVPTARGTESTDYPSGSPQPTATESGAQPVAGMSKAVPNVSPSGSESPVDPPRNAYADPPQPQYPPRPTVTVTRTSTAPCPTVTRTVPGPTVTHTRDVPGPRITIRVTMPSLLP